MKMRGPALVHALEKVQRAPETVPKRELRDHVYAVVDAGRELHWPPERVIIAVKKCATDAGLRPSQQIMSDTGTLLPSDELLTDLIRWAIERYYKKSNDSAASQNDGSV
jgi:hypothetical protein